MSKKIIGIIILSLVIYNIIPILNDIFPETVTYTFLLDLWFINSLYSLIAAIVFCKKYGFKIWISIIIALLFLPTMFIFYNKTAYIYMIVYFIFALIGTFIGANIAIRLEVSNLRKCFGIFLIIIAIYQTYSLYYRYRKEKNRNNITK